ncbi:MAG: tetratricopeptide repeat protein [Candidatus Aminicenantes bacterium]|jgi:tetratricopeptide (TPR) repeat protein
MRRSRRKKVELRILILSGVVIFLAQGAYSQVNKYFDMADRLILSQQYRKAINQYFKGISILSGRTRDAGRQQTRVWDDIGYAYLELGDYTKAADNLNNAISFHPFDFDAHFYLAVSHLMNKDYDRAQSELTLIENNIFFDERWIDGASIFQKRNGRILNRDELVRSKKEKGVYLERIDDVEILFNLDVFWGILPLPIIITGVYKGEVIVHLDAFDERNEGAFYYVQGLYSQEIGEFSKAEAKFRRAVNADYDEVDCRLRLAELFIAQGRFKEAKTQLGLAKELDEGHPEIAELMKFFLNKTQLKAEAPAKYKVRLNHRLKEHTNTLLPECHRKFFEVLKEGRIKDAISLLELALDVDERSYVVNHNLALTCYDVAKLEDSITDYLVKAQYYCARAIWLHDFKYVSKEHEAGTYDLMGNIYFYQSKYNDAKKEFIRSLDIDSENPIVLCNLGTANYNLNDWVRAAELWNKAIESEKSYIKPKGEGKKGSDGELQYVVTVLRKPISHRAHTYLGLLYRKQDLIEKSLEHYEKAVALEPKNPEPYLDLGEIYQVSGNKEMALECYQNYLYYGGREVQKAQKLIDELKKR